MECKQQHQKGDCLTVGDELSTLLSEGADDRWAHGRQKELQDMKLPRNSSDFHLAVSDLRPLGRSRDLPESIYGAAMMAAIRMSQRSGLAVHGVTASVFLGLALNVLMQVYVLYCTMIYITNPSVTKVRGLYARYETSVWADGAFSAEGWASFPEREDICQIPFSQPMFFMAILLIWMGTCWVDLKESISYTMLWCQLDRPSPRAHADVEEEEDGTLIARSASRLTKFMVLTLILLPKVVIGLSLLWLGARWLAATPSFEDLVLNAVALAFITELDELIYNVAMPEDVMALVRLYKIARPQEESPTPEHNENTVIKLRNRRFLSRISYMLSTIAVIGVLPVVYMNYLQQAIPEYRWDVQGLCTEWLADHEV